MKKRCISHYHLERQALWKALRSRGIPNILLDLIVALHEHTGSSVCHGGKLSTRFPTTSGVRQGCVLAPALFCVATDWILNHNHMDANPGIRVGSSFFTDLVYADDTTLFATSSQSAAESLILPECRLRPWYAYLLAKDKGPKPRYRSATL